MLALIIQRTKGNFGLPWEKIFPTIYTLYCKAQKQGVYAGKVTLKDTETKQIFFGNYSILFDPFFAFVLHNLKKTKSSTL